MRNKIAKFIKESVEWLIAEQQGCCTYRLDEHLAVCVGWSAGYGEEKRNDVIQGIDEPDFAINAGIKVWTSDATMLTDYDWINFPYDDDDVFDMDFAISPQEDWDRVAKYLLKMYNEVKDLEMNDDGKIIKEAN